MKFRRLTNEELAPLEQKFVQFLVINTITGDDWTLMKQRHPEQAMGLIDIFSDLIFTETLEKVAFLQFIEPKELRVFHCQKEKIELIALSIHPETPLDLTQPEGIANALAHTEGGISIFQSEKKYNGERAIELFNMIESGCRITDDFLYKNLEKLIL